MKIGSKLIGEKHPTYFIADIAANHDGSLERAKDLIYLAAESGADAAKFQHFKAETIVSDNVFQSIGTKLSHQSNWEKSVFEVYKDASINLGWTPILKETCDKAGIDFFTSPYSLELVDHIDPFVPAYKIGSGDITWIEIIKYIASKKKPYIIATGASDMNEVSRAVKAGLKINKELALLQCNTNYTGSIENFKYINLNVIRSYAKLFPNIILGLSDHTPGFTTVLGAISLGGRIIEKHFTDNNDRKGPDHAFSMNPKDWKEMDQRVKELEASLGNGIKIIENNEKETVVVQRRSINAAVDIPKGSLIKKEDLMFLRPCPEDAISPAFVSDLVGRIAKNFIKKGDYIRWSEIN